MPSSNDAILCSLTVDQPCVRAAGIFWGFVLRRVGFAGIFAPNDRIYLLPEHITDPRLARHELQHYAQRVRYGWFGFWWRCLWYVLRYGYRNSPFEIEARAAAEGEVIHDRCFGIPDATCPRCVVDDGPERTPPRFICTRR